VILIQCGRRFGARRGWPVTTRPKRDGVVGRTITTVGSSARLRGKSRLARDLGAPQEHAKRKSFDKLIMRSTLLRSRFQDQGRGFADLGPVQYFPVSPADSGS